MNFPKCSAKDWTGSTHTLHFKTSNEHVNAGTAELLHYYQRKEREKTVVLAQDIDNTHSFTGTFLFNNNVKDVIATDIMCPFTENVG